MIKEPVDYIGEFYNTIKDKYPHITASQVDNICRTYFKVLKAEMQKGTLKRVRLRYLGSFLVYKGRAVGLYNKTVKMFEDEKVTVDVLNYIRKIVKQYLKREYNEEIPH